MEETPATTAPRPLTPQEVVAYLRAHPEFLTDYPQAIDALLPTSGDEGEGTILDFQRHAIATLRDKLRTHAQDVSVAAHGARDQNRLRHQVQEVVLRLMELRTLEQCLECLCVDMPARFGVDVVRLGLESDMAGHYESFYPEAHYSGLVLTAPGSSESLRQDGQAVALVAQRHLHDPQLHATLFHECPDLASSVAYMALSLPRTGRNAVLALGVREAGRFQHGQPVDALVFLARAVALRLDGLLDDQAAGLV